MKKKHQEAGIMAVLGIWMWQQNVQQRGAEKTVSYCARAGVTDIYFLTKGLAGTAAFHSAYAPHTCERDLLQELIDEAHQCGIRVHAWFTSACDESYKALHPESGRCHFVRGRDRELISLADEGYLSYMEKIIRELCRNYDIDGLHLDYIRYNHLTYGWAEEDLMRYQAEGADTDELRRMMHRMFVSEPKEENLLFDQYRAGNESVLALARTRRKDVVRFASVLTGVAKAERSGLILSAALMPEGAYDDLAFSDLHYGQNYEDAAKLYDYALPMAYSRAYGRDAQWVKRVAEGTMKRGLKTIVGLHAYEGGSGLSLRADIEALRDTPVSGICLFREGATAMGYADGKAFTLYNALDQSISRVVCRSGESTAEYTAEYTASIAPGDEKTFRLPFETDSVQVFTGEKEASAYLAHQKK